MTPIRRIAWLLSLALPVVAAAGPATVRLDAAKPLDTPAGIVDGPTARALVKAGAVIVDVRTPEEFAKAHVPGAKNVPYDQIATRAAEIGDAKTPVLVYCRTGRRSAIAADTLEQLGYHRVWDMQVLERWGDKAQ